MVARLGEHFGDKFADVLLGKGEDDAFQAEVIDKLRQLETKLDTVIQFLMKELPEVVRGEFKNELIRTTFVHLMVRRAPCSNFARRDL